jgi:hypothetical protein
MGEKTSEGQSGGVNITGRVGSVSGDIVGRDKIVGAASAAALDAALKPLIEAIGSAPAENRAEAEAKLTALKQEAAKGERPMTASSLIWSRGLLSLFRER